MKGQIFNPGQPQKKESFDNNQDSHESAIRERLLDFVTPGIIDDSQDNSETIPFEIAPDTGIQIRVGTGLIVASHDVSLPEAVDAADLTKVGGERVLIPAADVSDIIANLYARSAGGGPGTGTGTGPFKESPNGLGGWTSTPTSTKTRHIPLTNGVFNYVWVTYLRAVDASVTALHKVNTSLILYTKKVDGYDIRVTTSASLPDGDPKWEYLGSVDLTTSPVSVTTGMISHAGRRYALVRPKRVSFQFNTALAPSSYDATTRTIRGEEHINAIGTGVVTPANPHGMTLADLGFTQDVDLRTHRLKHHSNGLIVPNTASTTSAMYPRTDTSTPVVGDAAMVYLKRLIADEALLMNGNVFDDAGIDPANKLVAPIGSASVGDYYVSFGTSHAAGVYAIIAKQSGTLVQFEKRVSPYSFNAETEYIVTTVQWSGTGFISPTPPSVQDDNRLFGSISNRNIQEDAVSTLNIQDSAVTTPKIANANVTTPKIADQNVTTPKIADLNVTTLKIADQNVTTAKIADQAVESVKLPAADGTTAQSLITGQGVKTGHIQDDAITSQKLAEWDGSSAATATNSGSGVATGHLKDGVITIAKLEAAVLALVAGGASPVGSITAFAGTTPPPGWLECNGAAVSRTTYLNLFNVLATPTPVWGVGDGSTTFNLPDLRGRFLRGWDHAAGRDPDAGTRTAFNGGNSGDNVGSLQDDSLKDHTHLIWGVGATHGGGPNSLYNGINGAYTSASGGVSTTPNAETRPKNANVMYIIRY